MANNPYYERRMQKRDGLINILNLAKENGCECYITNPECGYDYGFMVFPVDGTIMYVQNGDFWGYKFTIEYRPSRETGTGCACTDEPVTEITWDALVSMKFSGQMFALSLGAKFYSSPEEWKKAKWNFKDLIKI